MKSITCKLAIIGALLFVCFTPESSFAKEQKNHFDGNGKSGIVGRIAILPGPWHIRIDTAKGDFVEEIQADEYGSFKVDLKPGTYLLSPFFPSIDGGGELVGVTQTVAVEKKQFTSAILFIVHGPE